MTGPFSPTGTGCRRRKAAGQRELFEHATSGKLTPALSTGIGRIVPLSPTAHRHPSSPFPRRRDGRHYIRHGACTQTVWCISLPFTQTPTMLLRLLN